MFVFFCIEKNPIYMCRRLAPQLSRGHYRSAKGLMGRGPSPAVRARRLARDAALLTLALSVCAKDGAAASAACWRAALCDVRRTTCGAGTTGSSGGRRPVARSPGRATAPVTHTTPEP